MSMKESIRLYKQAAREHRKAVVKAEQAERVRLHYAEDYVSARAGYPIYKGDVIWVDFADGPEWAEYCGLRCSINGVPLILLKRFYANGKQRKTADGFELEEYAGILHRSHPDGHAPPKPAD